VLIICLHVVSKVDLKDLDVDKTGHQDSLRFPLFHAEILDQNHWDAAETYGRIRVVISEGFSRPHRSPPFERVKDIIILSFQHAPLGVYKYLRPLVARTNSSTRDTGNRQYSLAEPWHVVPATL
jgi:hypothetical protein